MKLDIKGFILGSIIGTFLLVISGAIVGLLFVFYLQSNGGLYEAASSNSKAPLTGMILGLCLFSVIACFITGWLTAKLSKTNRLSTAIFVGVLLTCYAFIPTEDKDLLLTLIGALVPIPFCYFGANRFLKRASKFKNANAASGSAASTTRPF